MFDHVLRDQVLRLQVDRLQVERVPDTVLVEFRQAEHVQVARAHGALTPAASPVQVARV